jgi:hypothetical protein
MPITIDFPNEEDLILQEPLFQHCKKNIYMVVILQLCVGQHFSVGKGGRSDDSQELCSGEGRPHSVVFFITVIRESKVE